MLRLILRYAVFLLLGWLTTTAISAPAIEQLISRTANVNTLPPAGRQILFLSPEAQVQLKPNLKLQTPILQTLVPIGRIQNAANDHTIIFYPSPLADDDDGQDQDIYNQIIQIIQMWGQVGGGLPTIPGVPPANIPGFPGFPIGGGGGSGSGSGGINGDDNDCDDNNDSKDKDKSKVVPYCGFTREKYGTKTETLKQLPARIELNPEAEEIPQGAGQTPASTVPLPPNNNNNKKIFTISGIPQFYGNFDIFQNPIRPVFNLQPLEPIKIARSMTELKKQEDNKEKVEPAEQPLLSSNSLSPVLPLQSGDSIPQALPLRSRIRTEEEKEQENENPIDPEYKPGVAAGRFAQFLIQQRVLQPENQFDNQKPPIQQFITSLGQTPQSIALGNLNQKLPGNEIQQFIQPIAQPQFIAPGNFIPNQPGVAAQEFLQVLNQPQIQPIIPNNLNQNQPGVAAQEFIQTIHQQPLQQIVPSNENQPGKAAQELIQILHQGPNQQIGASNQNQPGQAAQEFIQTLSQAPSPGIISNNPASNQPGAAAEEFLQTLGQAHGEALTSEQSGFQNLAQSQGELISSNFPNQQYQNGIATQEFLQPLGQGQGQDQLSNNFNRNQLAGTISQTFQQPLGLVQSSVPILNDQLGPQLSAIQISGQAQSVSPNNPKPIHKPTGLDDSIENNPERLGEDPSIAQARPVAIAITGQGGLAQSAPVGTAIASNDGYALSSPSATAIAGDFSIPEPDLGGIEDDKRKKQ